MMMHVMYLQQQRRMMTSMRNRLMGATQTVCLNNNRDDRTSYDEDSEAALFTVSDTHLPSRQSHNQSTLCCKDA